MKSYFDIIRFNICILSTIATISGALISKCSFSSQLIYISLCSFLITAAGNIINDVADYRIDAIDKPYRPIPAGKINRLNAFYYYLLMLLIGNIIAYMISFSFFIFAIFNSLILTLYAFYFKRIALMGNLLVAYLSSSCILAVRFIQPSPARFTNILFIFTAIVFLGTLAREIIKDIEDLYGDSMEGAVTLPVLIGEHQSRFFANGLLIVALCLLLYNASLHDTRVDYFLSFVLTNLILFSFLYSAKKAQKILKFLMFLIICQFSLIGIS